VIFTVIDVGKGIHDSLNNAAIAILSSQSVPVSDASRGDASQ
jgi:hypothetical protein